MRATIASRSSSSPAQRPSATRSPREASPPSIRSTRDGSTESSPPGRPCVCPVLTKDTIETRPSPHFSHDSGHARGKWGHAIYVSVTAGDKTTGVALLLATSGATSISGTISQHPESDAEVSEVLRPELLECWAQHAQCAADAGFDGLHGQLQDAGDLCIRQAVFPAELQDGGVADGEGGNGTADAGLDFLGYQASVGVGGDADLGGAVAMGPGARDVAVEEALALPVVERVVARGGVQIRAQGVAHRPFLAANPQREEQRLHELLGDGSPAHESFDEAAERIVVGAEEILERVFVAVADPRDARPVLIEKGEMRIRGTRPSRPRKCLRGMLRLWCVTNPRHGRWFRSV